VKAFALASTALFASSVQALAHSGHVPVAGSTHAVEHALGDLLAVMAAVAVIGAGVLIAARIRRRR
jgi:hypothetical protein